jgi:hypothetical protein
LQDLLACYEPAFVNYDGFASGTLLTLGLANDDPASRVAIASRLLDDGADVTIGHPLHVLVGQNTHDFVSEAILLERMLDAGADVNEVMPNDNATPLEAAASKFKFSDRDLTPFYDVFLSRPDIDLLAPGLDGRPVLVNLRKWYALRADLVERAEKLLTERGIALPEPTP